MNAQTREKKIDSHSKGKADVFVAIIGAGFSGLGMAVRLQEAGIQDYLIVEAADEVGGTWRDSRYPGAAVDVPNHLYSYSFFQNADWSRMFAKSEEIQSYIVQMTDHFNLRPKIKFNTRVVEAQFNEADGLWEIHTQNGEKMSARYVVAAMGPFAEERIPNIPGLDKFKGQTTHTARWKPDVEVDGKRVAVVGSGASAIQVGPALAPRVKELKIFQRTPSWVVPKVDYEYSELEKFLYRYLPFTQKLRRGFIFAATELLATGIVYDTPMTSFLEDVCKRQIDQAIKDPALREKVTPDYRLGKTRMLISNDWYPTLARDNVELVDHSVEAVTEKGVIAGGKEYEVDTIVWATGYRSPSEGFPFPITGRDGVELDDYWKNGAKGYKGVAVTHFPNIFTLMGPNTGPGHTSVLVYVEAQQKYISQALQLAREEGYLTMEVRPDAQAAFNHKLDEKMAQTTWGAGGDSWYYTKDGRNTTLYPGFATDYVLSVREFDGPDFELSRTIAPEYAKKSAPEKKSSGGKVTPFPGQKKAAAN